MGAPSGRPLEVDCLRSLAPSSSRIGAALVAALALLGGCLGPVSNPGEPVGDDTVTIQHAAGNTTIEGTPERVVALEFNLVEDVLALGIQPVGVADVDGYRTWVQAEPALAENVADVGTRQEPSLETIAELDPDLILGVQFRHEPLFDQLSQLAPTLLFDPYPGPDEVDQYERVLENFRTVAQAVDRSPQAQATVEELQRTFEQAHERLVEANVSGQQVTLAQAFTQEGSPTLRVFTDNALAIQVLERIGLENAWDGGFREFGFSTVGLEGLEHVENATFLYVAQPDDDPINGTYSNDPVWQNLTFVQEDRVYPLGSDVWLFGGPLSATYLAESTVQTLEERRP